MGKMPGGDILLLALIALGSIWWLGVQYGASGVRIVQQRVEVVREVVREVQREQVPVRSSTGQIVPPTTPSTFQYMTALSGAVFLGTQPQWMSITTGVTTSSFQPYQGR